MADDKSTTTPPPLVDPSLQPVFMPMPVPVVPAVTLDETVEGGAYKVGDVWRNAEGQEIKAPKGAK